jgi:hypothetical protein
VSAIDAPHRINVRCADGIVHDVRAWRTSAAACGVIVHDPPKGEVLKIYARFRGVGSGPEVDDPVDCMACVTAHRTPYAVLCDDHGQRFLTEEQYARQLNRPDSFWACPACGESSRWDDDEYEAAMDYDGPGPDD